MSFRTIVVSSRAKLETSLGYLVCRSEIEKRILLSEISTLIIQSTAVSMTAALLSELAKRNIKVVFCDEKSNPESELVAYSGNSLSSRRIQEQLLWDEKAKADVWGMIVKAKISRQAETLRKHGINEKYLQVKSYVDEVTPGDRTNREGFAAKVYFNALFGEGFSRSDDCFVNGALNYGYSILLSAISRAVVANGYLLELGVKHHNEYNRFNLACDFMEPFRAIVDDKVKRLSLKDDFKVPLINLLNLNVVTNNMNTTLDNAIGNSVSSYINALNTGSVDKMSFIEDYEL